MSNGYAGRILHVDLTHGKLEVETPPESFYRKYLGGSAMGMHYILDRVKPGTDPLGPDNVLTLMVSVLTGAPISGQSRMCANALSPLTDGIGDSQCGGFFPAEMKFAGFDGIVVTGRAAEPVYLWLHDGQAELRPAGHLWGKFTADAIDLIHAELGDDKVEVAQIGPAGEKQVRTAAIINMANRANGRTGMGAVMGAKNLKAVAVRGKSKRLPMADAKRVNKLAKWGADNVEISGDMSGLRAHGTDGVLGFQHAIGSLPTYNWNAGQFEFYEEIMGETMTDTILKERDTCFGCAVHCKRVVETEWNGHAVLPRYGGPEYETCGTLGSYCGIRDLKAIAYGNQLCNAYGLDTIGTGATIAWAMECFENGLLDRGGDRLPGPLWRRRRHGPPGGDDRQPRGVWRPAGQRLAPRRRAVGQRRRVPGHLQGQRGPGPHAPGQALAGADLRRQPLWRRPPVIRARPDDRGRRCRPVHAAPWAAGL